MKTLMLAAVALVGLSSVASASDGILNGTAGSSLTRSEMAAIQGEGDLTIVQTNSQTNTSTGGTAQQANQNVQQIGFENVAVNSLSQDQSVETEVKKVAPPPPAKPTVVPKPPRWWKR
jgi:opacity protein-like surface antigen